MLGAFHIGSPLCRVGNHPKDLLPGLISKFSMEMDPRRPRLSSYDSTTFELNRKFQQLRTPIGHRRVTGNLTFERTKDVQVPSLAELSLQAHFKGYGRPKLWGALQALVYIQKKWLHLRARAYSEAVFVVQGVFRNLNPGQYSMAQIRRYNRIKLALRMSQARVRALS